MADTGKISGTQADNAKKTTLILEDALSQEDGYRYPYFFDVIMDEATDRYDLKEEDVMNKGLKIYTVLDADYQNALQDGFEEN